MRISQMSNSMGMSVLALNKTTREVNKSAQRIATGKKLNTDLVGDLGRLSTMKGHRATIKVDTENLNSAYDFAKVKDGALTQIVDLVQQINEAYAKGAEDTDAGVAELVKQVQSIITDTTFNGNKVFGDAEVKFGKSVTIAASTLNSLDAEAFKSDSISTTLDTILKETSTNGSMMNGFDARIAVNTSMLSNLDESISRIEDTDITEENLKLSQLTLQQQVSAAMISNMADMQTSLLSYLIK